MKQFACEWVASGFVKARNMCVDVGSLRETGLVTVGFFLVRHGARIARGETGPVWFYAC